MIALDTNVVVRLLVVDDARQAARARAALEQGPVLLLTSVVMETEWVLRKTYAMPRQDVCSAIRRLCGLPEVVLSEPEVVEDALTLHEKGLDFADALHVLSAAARGAERFLTFDRDLARRAAKVAPAIAVEAL